MKGLLATQVQDDVQTRAIAKVQVLAQGPEASKWPGLMSLALVTSEAPAEFWGPATIWNHDEF